MAERNVGRPWTEQEDALLTAAVAKHGEHDNWKNVALCVPGRSNKACRKRWLHSLSPNVKKTAWTPEEDKILVELYNQHGSKWSLIARSIPGRTDDACSKRYREALDPTLKKDEWTSEEDAKLLQVYATKGQKWGQIGQEMQRSGLACRNRWRLLERKKAAALKAAQVGVNQSISSQESSQPPSPSVQPSSAMELSLSSVQAPLTAVQASSPYAECPPVIQSTPVSTQAALPLLSPHPPEVSLPPIQIPTTSVQPVVSPLHINQPSSARAEHVPLPLPEQIQGLEGQTTAAEHLHDDTLRMDVWAPFYPPDSFHLSGEFLGQGMFSISPHIPAFHFSSSSLSEALSEPPVIRPLPPSSTPMPTMEVQQDDLPELFPQTAPTVTESGPNVTSGNNDNSMSLDDPSPTDSQESNNFSGTPFHLPRELGSPLMRLFQPINLTVQHPTMSSPPLSQSADFPIQLDQLNHDIWKSPNPFEFLNISSTDHSPLFTFDGSLFGESNYEDASSTSSTPFMSSSLSPASSPNVSSPVDLPLNEQPANGSLLFSTPRESPRLHTTLPPRRRTLPSCKKVTKVSSGPQRLSSSLPLSADPSVKPYGCGTESCWPAGAQTSSACFTTSKELFDHNRTEHGDDMVTEKPFRCALAGCGKSWKSINGLQYHLQISTAHFRNALSTRFSGQTLNNSGDQDGGSGTDQEGEEHEREYVCPMKGCIKAYKHSSGLRYHLRHGHPQNIPVQFAEVPPALARQLTNKAKRMRRKTPPEETT